MTMRASTHLVYGESGTFKTTQVGFFARWIHRKYGKKTRLVSAEGWFPIEKYVRAGIIEPYGVGGLVTQEIMGPDGEMKTPSPLAVLRLLSKGYWPKVTKAGTVRLMPPTPQDWEEIGAYAVEGLMSIGDLLMQELRDTQRKVAEDAVSPFTIKVDDNEVKFCANNKAHYGFVQREVHAIVRGFSYLPVHNVLFTAHEGKGEDEGTKEPIRGPAIVGKAATPQVPSWVGDCIHADSYAVKKTDEQSKLTYYETLVRMWYVRHPDPVFTNISYPAKPRVDSEQLPKLRAKWPGGYFIPTTNAGLDEFLEYEEQLTAEAASELAEAGAAENAA